jgi:hypothetical protein
VRIEWSEEFDHLLAQAEKEASHGNDTTLVLLGALLTELRALESEPTEESATFKLVRQARRHRLWRVAHPYRHGAAVRIICWFTGGGTVVVALVGFDKARLGDVWYDSATIRAEALVDQWLREEER